MFFSKFILDNQNTKWIFIYEYSTEKIANQMTEPCKVHEARMDQCTARSNQFFSKQQTRQGRISRPRPRGSSSEPIWDQGFTNTESQICKSSQIVHWHSNPRSLNPSLHYFRNSINWKTLFFLVLFQLQKN